MNQNENIPGNGANSERIYLDEVVNVNCPNCEKSPVRIYERVLIEGSLENYHLVHTEVEDHYECPFCKHNWKKFQFL